MNFIRHRISREEGVAAVEFGIILPVLCLFLFGVLEFGRVWSQYQVFQGAAREGARCAAVASTSNCDIVDEIKSASEPYTPNLPASITLVDGSGKPIGGGGRPNGCLNADAGQDIMVSWDQPLQIDIPFWNNITVTSTIKAVFRCE